MWVSQIHSDIVKCYLFNLYKNQSWMCDLDLRLMVNDNYGPFSESHDVTRIGIEISGTNRCG